MLNVLHSVALSCICSEEHYDNTTSLQLTFFSFFNLESSYVTNFTDTNMNISILHMVVIHLASFRLDFNFYLVMGQQQN